jgi:hypothetical protein
MPSIIFRFVDISTKTASPLIVLNVLFFDKGELRSNLLGSHMSKGCLDV